MKKILYVFGQLSDNDIEWLINNGKKEHYKAGDVLIKKDKHIDKIFIILYGSLLVFNETGKKITELSVGDIVGEMSFVDKKNISNIVKAKRDSKVFAIDKARLEDRINSDPSFISRFINAIGISVGLQDSKDNAVECQEEQDELNDSILDNISLAGDRFQRMLNRMLGITT